MCNKHPFIEKKGDTIKLYLFPEDGIIEKREKEFILDFNLYGELIAIEIINLKNDFGKNCLKYFEDIGSDHKDVFEYSYDKDCDAFDLKLKNDWSSDQCSIIGEVRLNAEMNITGLRLTLPREK